MAESNAIVPILGRYLPQMAQGRNAWYRQYLAIDLKDKSEVVVKMLRLTPGQQRGDLGELKAWYTANLQGVPGVVQVQKIELEPEKDLLYVIEQQAVGQPLELAMRDNLSSGEVRQHFQSLLLRLEALHDRGVLHNCLLPDSLTFDRRGGWQIADCGWLRWCCLNGYAPEGAPLPDAWTAMSDCHQLGALLAHLLLNLEITPADLPLRATSDLKRQARQLPSPWPGTLLQLWGPAVTDEWSSIKAARMSLEGRTDLPPPLTDSSFASSAYQAATNLPITGSIPAAAAISSNMTHGMATPVGRAMAERSSGEIPASSVTRGMAPLTVPDIAPPTDPRAGLRENTLLARSIFFALMLSLAFTGGLLYALSSFLFRPTVHPMQVPDVVGMTVSAAKKAVEPKGFSITVSGAEYSQDVPRDKILRQSPGPNTTVKEFREVFITLSRGARTIKLPSLIGLEEAAAVESLTKLELKPGQVSHEYTRGVPVGQVIDQDPPANQLLAKEESVNLVVSKGALKSDVMMPKVIGKALPTALAQLADVGLQVRKVIRHYDYEATTTTVALQSPAPGAGLEEGDTVTLTVTTPKSQEPLGDFQVRIAVVLPAYEGQRQVRVVIRDGRGERQVYGKDHSGGDKVEMLVDTYQTTRVLIYIDNKLLREEQY